MCRFSGHVREVGATKIFAGDMPDGRQLLIYEMKAAFDEPVAMVLPLPVPADGPDDAVTFVDLSRSAHLFTRLDAMFGAPAHEPRGGPPRLSTLAVHDVGHYEASYVARPQDFGRLDPRFRLPPHVMAALPEYADWGFAVFQLRARPSATTHFHPMGLSFPRRDHAALFFPTGHVHDGVVHPSADFDHRLFAQVSPAIAPHLTWEHGTRLDAATCAATGIDPARPVYATTLAGPLPNHDGWLRAPDLAIPTLAGPRHRSLLRVPRLVQALPGDEPLPDATRALAATIEVLTTDLPRLLGERAAAWSLGTVPVDDPTSQAPNAIEFDLAFGQSWGGVRPSVTLAFLRAPDPRLTRDIHRDLMSLHAHFAARLPA